MEAGALDGDGGSVSKYFEVRLNWTGLLIEPNPYSYMKLLKKNRKAFSINAGISPYNYASYLQFAFSKAQSAHIDTMFPYNREYIRRFGSNLTGIVPCFPLYSMLKAIDISYIDLLSLDVQGTEEFILKNIPFDKLSIGMINVEYGDAHSSKYSLKRLERYKQFFNKTGLFKFVRKRGVDALFQNIHYNTSVGYTHSK